MLIGGLANKCCVVEIVGMRVIACAVRISYSSNEHFFSLTLYHSSYMDLALCAIVATFKQTARVSFLAICPALQAVSDENMKCCLDNILSGNSECMMHVERMQIPAQILHTQSMIFQLF